MFLIGLKKLFKNKLKTSLAAKNINSLSAIVRCSFVLFVCRGGRTFPYIIESI